MSFFFYSAGNCQQQPYQQKYLCMFLLLFITIVNTTNVTTYIDSSPLKSMTIYSSLMADQGKTVYISVLENSIKKIKKYDLSNQNLSLVGQYISGSNLIATDGIFIYNNTYLLGHSTTNLKFNLFWLGNFTFIGAISVNDYFSQFYHSPINKIILFKTRFGRIGYYLQTDFPKSNNYVMIVTNLSPSQSILWAISPDQNYLAYGSKSDTYVIIYSLSKMSILYSYTTTGVDRILWMDKQILFIIQSNGDILNLNCTNNYQIKNSLSYTNSSSTQYASDAVYLSQTKQLVLMIADKSGKTNNTFVQTFSPAMKTATYLKTYAFTNQVAGNVNVFYHLFASLTQKLYFNVYDSSTIYFEYMGLDANNSLANSTINATNFVNTAYYSSNNTNGTVSQPNSTNSTSINLTTNATNSSIASENTTTASTNIGITNEELSTFQNFMSATVSNQAFSSFNSLPGSRKFLQPIFTFFTNFDDLWLYIYHQREYDVVISSIFKNVQQLQSEKWNALPIQKIWTFLGININNTLNELNSKQNQTSWKFVEVENSSNGFLINTLNFFCSNLVLMLLIFIVCKIVFHLLFNYRISILFREFSFWPYFLIMILEGNFQYFTYLISFQFQNFFSVNFINKMALGLSVTLYFMLFIFSLSAIFIIKSFYGRLVRYFMQNLNFSLLSTVYITINMGYKQVLLGFCHSIFSQNYLLKIGILLSIEVSLLIITLFILTRKNCVVSHFKVWINVVGAILRIALIFTLFFDKQDNSGIFVYVHLTIFYIYILLMLTSIFSQTIRVIWSIFSFFVNNQPQKLIKQIQKMKRRQNKGKIVQVFSQDQSMNFDNNDRNFIQKRNIQFYGNNNSNSGGNGTCFILCNKTTFNSFEDLSFYSNNQKQNTNANAKFNLDLKINQNKLKQKQSKESKFYKLKLKKAVLQIKNINQNNKLFSCNQIIQPMSSIQPK